MAYLGNTPQAANRVVDVPSFTAGSSTAVTLTQNPGSIDAIDVYFDGLLQLKDSISSLSGTTLTFTAAIPADVARVEVRYARNVYLNVPTDGSVTTAKLADDSVTVDKFSPNLLPVVQVVYTQTGAVATGTTQIPIDDTIPQNTEGDQYMSATITPKSATNKLVIDVVFNGTASTQTGMVLALFQDSTASAIAVVSAGVPVAGLPMVYTLRHEMLAGTTSATTFKLRAGPSGAFTVTFNGQAGGRLYGGVLASSIRITEFAG